jgi:hypothetical protein
MGQNNHPTLAGKFIQAGLQYGTLFTETTGNQISNNFQQLSVA